MPTTEKRAGRRMPVRTADLTFSYGDVEWHATLRVDAPSGVVDDFFTEDSAALKRALTALVLAWDAVDQDGAPVPLPKDGGLTLVPYPYINALVAAYLDALAPPKG